MESLSLTGVVDEQIAAATSAHSGRAAHTVYGGHEHSLRQTVIALAAGQELAEHETPGEATLLVLRGHVRLIAGADSVDGSVGRLSGGSTGPAQPVGHRGLRGAVHRAVRSGKPNLA